jgi:hypothetical protein
MLTEAAGDASECARGGCVSQYTVKHDLELAAFRPRERQQQVVERYKPTLL